MLKKQDELETIHGYFKLNCGNNTTLNLCEEGVEKSDVMWLYFTAIQPKNPQMRAWFHAIKGPAFKDFNQGNFYIYCDLPAYTTSGKLSFFTRDIGSVYHIIL